MIKTDREVSKLYVLKDEVCPNDRDQFYNVNLEIRLAQTLSAKQQWVVRWKLVIIKASQKRAKRDSLINTKPIWQHYGSSVKPKFKIRPEHAKRNKQHRAILKKSGVNPYAKSQKRKKDSQSLERKN